MRISTRPLLPALVLGVAGLSLAHGAHAGCGVAPSPLKPNAWHPQMQAAAALQTAFYSSDSSGQFLQVSDEGGWSGPAPIVGMWRFKLTGPGNSVVDQGYAQWHADGTEIQNSGLHAPITSNFCLGVWKETAPGKYQLNHFPLAWDASGQSPANAIQLTESVKLTDADHMTGTFKLKVYLWSTTDSLNVNPTTPVAVVTGTITATRVTVNSTVPGATE